MITKDSRTHMTAGIFRDHGRGRGGAAAGRGLGGREGLVEVGPQVVGVLQAR